MASASIYFKKEILDYPHRQLTVNNYTYILVALTLKRV